MRAVNPRAELQSSVMMRPSGESQSELWIYVRAELRGANLRKLSVSVDLREVIWMVLTSKAQKCTLR